MALERLRESAAERDAPTQPTLWPEHFDIAIEMGTRERGLRANYGCLAGDEHHDRSPTSTSAPGPPSPRASSGTRKGFPGAEISYAELAAAGDPVAAAVDFATERSTSWRRTRHRMQIRSRLSARDR